MTAGADLGDNYILCLIDTQSGRPHGGGCAHPGSGGAAFSLSSRCIAIRRELIRRGEFAEVATVRWPITLKASEALPQQRKTDRIKRRISVCLAPESEAAAAQIPRAHMAIIRSRQALVGCRTRSQSRPVKSLQRPGAPEPD